MKIENIKINSYGTLNNKNINLENKINIIYGTNESGKSTLLSFIKNMFYGISKNKNGKEISDYEKYLPWDGKEYSGKIKYELNNGNKYEIFRNFGGKEIQLINGNFEDEIEKYSVDKKVGSQFFYEQTGVSEKNYISTIMSIQKEVILEKSDQTNLVQKITNLGGTGDEEISFQKAIELLNKKQTQEIGNIRTQDKPLNILQNKKENLKIVLKSEIQHNENKQNLQAEKEEIEQNLEKEKQKKELISELNKLINEKEIKLENLKYKNNIKKENNEKIENLFIEKDELLKKIKPNLKIKLKNKNYKSKNENNKNNVIAIFILMILIIINILNFIFIKNKIINYGIFSLIPISIIIYFLLKMKNKKNILTINEKTEEEINLIINKIKFLKEQNEKIDEEIKEEKKQIEQNFKKEKQKLKIKYASIYDIETIAIEEKVEIEKCEENSNNKIINYQMQLNRIQYEENTNNEQLEKIINAKEELAEVDEKIFLLEEKNKYINEAKEFLKIAHEKMKNNVTPKITEKLSKIVEEISNGKYKKVSMEEEQGIIVELENGKYIPASILSTGTVEELYLSLRLSMLDEISNEKMPVILDEAFAYFDDERLKNVLAYLNKHSNEHQTILFTCTNREKQILDEMKMDYNLIIL